MNRPWRFGGVVVIAAVLTCLAPSSAARKNKNEIPAVRWDEGNPGCGGTNLSLPCCSTSGIAGTFSEGDDGNYRYGMLPPKPGEAILRKRE